MDGIIKQIEKGKPFFEKISRNSYLGAVRDGFLTAMPAILFSSIFILIAAVPEIFGYQWPESVSTWLWKVYNYSMGVVGLLVSATTARCLADSMNRRLPKNKVINTTSVMLASVVSFLLLSVSPIEGGFSTEYMGTKGLLASFVAAFLTVNLYKFCVLKDITIKMPKEVPGTISQTFRDIFPFSFSVFAAVLIDLGIRQIFQISFAEAIITVLQPLFTAADGYLGIAIIWGAMALFWFVGVHGPSIVEPAIAAIIYANVETNLQLFNSGEQASKVLTVGLGNFVGTMGGTGAPMILNPYFFIPFLLTPVVNVCLFKFFVDVLGMNSFMYVLPWATPAPIGLVLGTGMGILAFVLAAVLIVVDFLIYLPFCKAYDAVLVEKEAQKAEVIATEEGASADVREEVPVAASQVISDANKEINVLVLCAGAGTSAMLANALKKGASESKAPISAMAGAYGSHYEMLQDFDMVVLAPQVNSYYDDIKEDTDRLGIKLVATKGAEYIGLTRDPEKAVQFILNQFQ
ncbi:PTS lactose transporter subunit IIBC [Enterococcus faecium]|uniref:PTS lactose transporter subunit IIBC n=1 Tax=Enterococcus faecium TaxID=1352 RepID=UPI0033906604